MRSDWVDDQSLNLALALLTPQDRLIMQLCIHTGLRVGDVLALKTVQLKPRLTVHERKTGKSRRITIPSGLLEEIQAQAGDVWAFPGAAEGRPRARQSVWRDVKRAAKAMRLEANLTPHTGRKVYAVRAYEAADGDLAAVQRKLNHEDVSVTLLYAMADKMSAARNKRTKTLSRPR